VERLVGRRGVRLFEIVDEPIVIVFAARKLGLDGARLVEELRSFVAILELELGLVLGEILVGLRTAGFEERDLQTRFREAFAGPAAGGARADNYDVKGMVFLLEH
jgi:hypothetical protein